MGARFVAAAFALALSACSSSDDSPAPPASGTNDAFAEGRAFPELALEGYLDKNKDATLAAEEHGALKIADVVGANPAAEVLLVHVAFGWCKYCWEETAAQLKMTKGYGGRFVSVQILVQDRDGNPATRAFEDEWTRLNKSTLATALEPAGTLLKRFGRSAPLRAMRARDAIRRRVRKKKEKEQQKKPRCGEPS